MFSRPEGLALRSDVIERPLDVLAVLAPAGRVAGGQEGQRPHAHQPQVVRFPVALGPLILGQPFQPALERGFAFGRDLPIVIRRLKSSAARAALLVPNTSNTPQSIVRAYFIEQ